MPQTRCATDLRRATRLGMVGVLVLYGGLVSLWILCVPVFGTWDEAANVDYSLQLSYGRLPVANSEYRAAFPELGQNARGQYVSNHGPLFHALVSPLVRIAEGSDHARLFLVLARAVSAIFGAAAIVVVGLTARALLARSPRAAGYGMVGAAGVVAVVPEMVAASGAHRNDVLTALLASITMLVLVRAVRLGLGTRAVGLVAVVCTLGMLCRISFLPVWLLGAGAVAILSLWPDLRPRRPDGARLRTAALRTAAVVGAPLVGAGWFYALSLRRYGDLTGGGVLYPRVARRPYAPGAEEGPLSYLLTPTTWWTQFQQLGGIRSTVQPDDHAVHTVIAVLVIGALVLAVAANVVRVRVCQWRLLDRLGRWQLAGLAVLAVAICAELAHHVANKGAENQRYLLNAMTSWGSGAALLVTGAGRRLAPFVTAGLTALLTVGTVIYTVERIQDLGLRGDSWFGTLALGFEQSGVDLGAPVVAALLVTTVCGLVLFVVGLARIAATPAARAGWDDAAPDPAGPRAPDRAHSG